MSTLRIEDWWELQQRSARRRWLARLLLMLAASLAIFAAAFALGRATNPTSSVVRGARQQNLGIGALTNGGIPSALSPVRALPAGLSIPTPPPVEPAPARSTAHSGGTAPPLETHAAAPPPVAPAPASSAPAPTPAPTPAPAPAPTPAPQHESAPAPSSSPHSSGGGEGSFDSSG